MKFIEDPIKWREQFEARLEKTRAKALRNGFSYESRAVSLSKLGFTSYAEYLKSPLWRRVRAKVYAQKGNRCWLCQREASAVHHNRYHKNDLSGKCLRNLFPICDECHVEIEFGKGGKKLDVDAVRSRFVERERAVNNHLTSLIFGYFEE